MTRNNNETRKKANAVFFSAIMVLSMVAVGFAALPAAAAAGNDHGDFTYDPANPWQGQDVVTSDLDADQGDEFQVRRVTNIDNDQVSSSSFIEDVVAGVDGEVTIETGDLAGGDYFISGSGLNRTPMQEDTFEVRIQSLDVEFDDDTVSDAGGDSTTDLEIDSNRGTYSLNVSADGDLDEEELLEVFVDQNVADGALVSLHQTDSIRNAITFGPDGNPLVGGQSLSDSVADGTLEDAINAGFQDLSSSERQALLEAINDVDSAAVDVGDGEIADMDAFLGVFGDLNPFFAFSFDESEDDADEQVVMISITDREEEVDFAGIDDGDYEFLFEVTDTDAEATASITVDDVADAELEFVDSTVDVAQGGVVAITVAANDAADEGTLVIGEIDDYGYQLNVTITDFNDDDEITLYFNTYTAGTTGDGTSIDDVIWVDEDDEDDGAELGAVEEHPDSESLEFILSVGDYDMSVLAETGDFGETVDNPDDVGSLLIDERETNALNVWTASDDTVDDIDDVDDVLAGAAAGNVTERDLVAQDDWAIFELDATGLDGMFRYAADNGGLSAITGEDATGLFEEKNENDRAARVRLRETRASAGPNTDRRLVNWEEADYAIITTEGQSNVFIAVDTDSWNDDDDVFDPGTALDEEDDYEFIMNFRLEDEWLLEFDDEDDEDLDDLYEMVESAFDVEERTGAFVNDPYNVTATEDVQIVATTNVAPGTELTIRARSSGDTRPSFIKSQTDLVVTQDEDVTGTFDFSDTNVGDTFDLTLRPTNQFPDDVEADGNIVDAVDEDTPTPTPEDTPTPTPDEDTPTPTPDEDTPTPTPEDTPEPTDDDTPGFGAVVALVALVAAALLATRRRSN